MLIIADSCTKCGICKDPCPTYAIDVQEDGPVLVSENCILCGQCEAICPEGALTNTALSHEQDIRLDKYPVLDAETAELFLRSRRSCRSWKPGIVPRETTEKLLQIGRYAATGSNMQGVSYLVIEKPEVMKKLEAMALDYYAKTTKPDDAVTKEALRGAPKALLRGAPMMILALTEKALPRTFRSGQFALTYVELYAPTLGLGTCWSGYMERFFKNDIPEVNELLGIPAHLEISAALLYGQAKHRYYKLTNRNKAEIYWA